ncbi:MAG: HEAT repeat domain-containing protein [Desulfovibrio sp.]|jgi:HEAT repeat protein|nr:HEAT repeat domain-containing protein [Desulfovibrio sp.]
MPEPTDILELLRQDDPEQIREGAKLARAERMTGAIPDLVRHIASPNIGVQEAVDRALRKIGGPAVVHAVIPLLRSDDAPERNIAMDLLRVLGNSDLPAVQELLRDEDADVRIFASDILGSTGSALAVPALCHALLNDPEVNVRYQAAVSLGQLAFPEAAPCLNSALDDEEWVQFSVIESLTKIKDASSIGAMVKALGKSSELVASSIVDALGEMGNIKAVPLLLKGLDNSPSPLCNKIVRAVLNIVGGRSLTLLGTKDCRRLAGYLPSALEDEDKDIQDAAIRGFAALGGEGATTCVLRHLTRLDPENDAQRVAEAVDALVKIGKTPELYEALRGGDDHLAAIAMEVMLRVDEEGTIPLLIAIFPERGRDMQRQIIQQLATRAGREHQAFFLGVLENCKDGNIVREALHFLGRKGDPAPVLDKILPFLSHPYNDVKDAALEACIALHTPEVEEIFRSLAKNADALQRMIGVYGLGFFDIGNSLELLRDALDDPSAEVRKVAVEAFGRCSSLEGECRGLIENMLHDESRDVRLAVYDTLRLNPDERFFQSLINGLEDDDAWVRIRCAERLGEFKVDEAIGPLVGMLADENPLIVVKIVSVLASLGGETAFRALMPLLDHPDGDVREAVEAAINAIHKQAGGE